MFTYKMLGGGSVSGNNSTEIVETIRSFSFNPMEKLQDFMNETSAACKLYNSKIIRASNPEIFVQDLLVNGFLNTTGTRNKTK